MGQLRSGLNQGSCRRVSLNFKSLELDFIFKVKCSHSRSLIVLTEKVFQKPRVFIYRPSMLVKLRCYLFASLVGFVVLIADHTV